MTDRIKGFIVTLDADMRDDDSEAILMALRMVKRVADVRPIASDGREMVTEIRQAQKFREMLYDLIDKLK